MAPKQWVLGWRRRDHVEPGVEEEGDWEFILDQTEAEPETLKPGVAFEEPEIDDNIHRWLSTLIASKNSNNVFSALEDLADAFSFMEAHKSLHDALNEVVTAAYKAGRQNLLPPEV